MLKRTDLSDVVAEVSQKEIPDFWGGWLPFACIKPNSNKRTEKLIQGYVYYEQMLSEGLGKVTTNVYSDSLWGGAVKWSDGLLSLRPARGLLYLK